MQENGVFSINSMGYGFRIYVWDPALAAYYTRYLPLAAKSADMGQRFLLSPNQGLPVMAAWRFLAVRVDFDSDRIALFLDGRRALDWQVAGAVAARDGRGEQKGEGVKGPREEEDGCKPWHDTMHIWRCFD